MDDMIDVTIPVAPAAAAALTEPHNREAIGRLVSRVLCPRPGPTPLARIIAEIKADSRVDGLTDAEIDAELADYKAERRSRKPLD